jgi:hypothetical protein
MDAAAWFWMEDGDNSNNHKVNRTFLELLGRECGGQATGSNRRRRPFRAGLGINQNCQKRPHTGR